MKWHFLPYLSFYKYEKYLFPSCMSEFLDEMRTQDDDDDDGCGSCKIYEVRKNSMCTHSTFTFYCFVVHKHELSWILLLNACLCAVLKKKYFFAHSFVLSFFLHLISSSSLKIALLAAFSFSFSFFLHSPLTARKCSELKRNGMTWLFFRTYKKEWVRKTENISTEEAINLVENFQPPPFQLFLISILLLATLISSFNIQKYTFLCVCSYEREWRRRGGKVFKWNFYAFYYYFSCLL